MVTETNTLRANAQTHLSWDEQTQTGKINSLASRSSILLNIDELLVVEFYSRRL